MIGQVYQYCSVITGAAKVFPVKVDILGHRIFCSEDKRNKLLPGVGSGDGRIELCPNIGL